MIRNTTLAAITLITTATVMTPLARAQTGCPPNWIPTYTLDTILPASYCTSVDLTPDGSTLYARVNFAPNQDGYFGFDLATNAMIGCEIRLSGVPWAGRVSADGNSLWTSRYYGGLVSQVDLASCQVLQTLDVGNWTEDVFFDDSRHYLYVAENAPGTGAIGSVQVIDTWSNPAIVICSIALNGEPGKFAKAPGDASLYLLTHNNAGNETLYKIDTTTCSTSATLAMHGVGEPGISVSPDASQVFVPHAANGVVNVVDAATMTIAASFPVTSTTGFLSGCQVAPSGTHAFVTRQGEDLVSVLDLASGTVVQDLVVPHPLYAWNRPAWSADGRTAYLPTVAGAAILSAIFQDCNGNGVADECEVPPLCPQCPDCNTNGIPDECEQDFDADDLIDDCDPDVDNDGVLNTADVCPFTPVGVVVDCEGRPRLDLNGDCAANGADLSLIVQQLLNQ